MQIEINIDNYLSESEKRELAIEAFKESIKESLFKGHTGVVASSDAQRIISNISYGIVEEMLKERMPDYEEEIIANVKKVIKGMSQYTVFRRADAWGSDNSEAVKIVDKTVADNRQKIINILQKEIDNYDYAGAVERAAQNELLDLSDKFGEIADFFGKLGMGKEDSK
ncbi:MAG: hypothetical protein RR371_02040 [Bacteroides sp.]